MADSDSSSPIVFFTLDYHAGNRELNRGDNSSAVQKYLSAIRVWKNSDAAIPTEMVAMCLTNLGTAYTRQKMFNDAIDSFDRSLEIHASFLMAQYNKAWLLEDSQRIDEAIEAWTAYLTAASKDRREQESILEAEKHLSLLKNRKVLEKHGVPYTTTSQLGKGSLFAAKSDQKADWSTITPCQECGAGNPGNAIDCIRCGKRLPTSKEDTIIRAFDSSGFDDNSYHQYLNVTRTSKFTHALRILLSEILPRCICILLIAAIALSAILVIIACLFLASSCCGNDFI